MELTEMEKAIAGGFDAAVRYLDAVGDDQDARSETAAAAAEMLRAVRATILRTEGKAIASISTRRRIDLRGQKGIGAR